LDLLSCLEDGIAEHQINCNDSRDLKEIMLRFSHSKSHLFTTSFAAFVKHALPNLDLLVSKKAR